MKIKEVTEKTNLTERAVRLYIENGLVAPKFNESYSGRRNIDFSSEDVEVLRRISVLRKSGFSIAQIKLMQNQPESCKDVLEEFIDETDKRIKADTEILSCLTPLLLCDELNVEQISRSIDKPVMKEKAIPVEDCELTFAQKILKKAFTVVGVIGFLISAACLVSVLRVEIGAMKNYLYPAYPHFDVLLFSVVAAVVIPLIIILLNRKMDKSGNKRIKLKTAASVVLLIVYLFCGYLSFVQALLTGVSHPESHVVSYTENEANYMLFDDEGAVSALSEFLPEDLSDAENIEYEYYYKNYGVWSEPPVTEVFVELTLDEKSFDETVEYYKSFLPSDSACTPYEESGEWKGEWTIIYYRNKYERAPTNYTPIFAYNSDENKVRMICSYGQVATKGAVNSADKYEWQ